LLFESAQLAGEHVPFKSVVLRLGSARQFSGDREAPSKKINTTLLRKKILRKIKFSGNNQTWQPQFGAMVV